MTRFPLIHAILLGSVMPSREVVLAIDVHIAHDLGQAEIHLRDKGIATHSTDSDYSTLGFRFPA